LGFWRQKPTFAVVGHLYHSCLLVHCLEPERELAFVKRTQESACTKQVSVI